MKLILNIKKQYQKLMLMIAAKEFGRLHFYHGEIYIDGWFRAEQPYKYRRLKKNKCGRWVLSYTLIGLWNPISAENDDSYKSMVEDLFLSLEHAE